MMDKAAMLLLQRRRRQQQLPMPGPGLGSLELAGLPYGICHVRPFSESTYMLAHC